MTNPKLYIVVHDYQHGVAALRIYANSKRQIEQLLKPPTWAVYEDSDPHRPRWSDESKFDTSDIEAPSDQLREQIFIQSRTSEGKSSFFYKVDSAQGTEYREIWAHTEDEIETRFPQFQSLMFVGMGPEIYKRMGTSDIDVPDEFLKRHSN